MESKKSYYAIIPATVRYDKNLTPRAILLYGEITALCNEKGYCWANNHYFAELYDVTKKTVTGWITQLEKNGYIKRNITYKNGSKTVDQRQIRLLHPTPKNVRGYRSKGSDPTPENVRDSTTVNNTKNNTTNKAVVDSLIKLGIKNTKKITDNYSESYINDRIDIANEKSSSNPAGYFIEILDKEITQELVEPM